MRLKYITTANDVAAGLKAIFSKWHFLIILIIFICPLTISSGDDSVSLTVKNSTSHFLHAIIEGKSFLFISPSKSVVYTREGSATLQVQIFYSPGQGVTGNWTGDINVSPYQTQTTGCESDQSSNGGCECSTNPATGGDTIREFIHPANDTLQVVL
jgi:hypothetical protein